MLTWTDEFRPVNKTIYVVFDEESDMFRSRDVKIKSRPIWLGKMYPIRNENK